MKILMPLLAVPALICAQYVALAQADTAKITSKALFFADSLLKTEHYENWSTYADLVPASIIKYYGGKDGYMDHVRTGRMRTISSIEETATPELRMISLRTQKDQWQCVIKMSRYFHKEEKKFHQITYFVGQSRDEGETWRLFDASYNSVANIIYMLPDVFDDLAIPQPVILSEEEELAMQQSAAKPAAGKKKSPVKK